MSNGHIVFQALLVENLESGDLPLHECPVLQLHMVFHVIV